MPWSGRHTYSSDINFCVIQAEDLKRDKITSVFKWMPGKCGIDSYLGRSSLQKTWENLGFSKMVFHLLHSEWMFFRTFSSYVTRSNSFMQIVVKRAKACAITLDLLNYFVGHWLSFLKCESKTFSLFCYHSITLF